MSGQSPTYPDPDYNGTHNEVGHLFRECAGKMTAVCTRIFGFEHSELIEDIVQDTFLTAMKVWPVKGMPANPQGWLMTVARNKTINALKRKSRLSYDIPETVVMPGMPGDFLSDEKIRDNQLSLLLCCCRPEFSETLRIQFTLKYLCGFHNREIAAALYASEAAVKKSIYRAVKKLRSAGTGLSVRAGEGNGFTSEKPGKEMLSEQLPQVLRILYLMFNEGYKSSTRAGVITEDLCFEALRLLKLLPGYLDSDNDLGACHALIALMLFNMARFPARQNEQGELIGLHRQGRENWDRDMVQAGFSHMKKSRTGSTAGKYHLEAYIAALHCSAASYEETRWDLIRDAYSELLKKEDSPIIRINYAIATGYAEDPETGLKILDAVTANHTPNNTDSTVFLAAAARADLYRKAGSYARAEHYYRQAAKLACSEADRLFIREQLNELSGKL